MSDKQSGWRFWGGKAASGALKVSDWAGGHANNVGAKFGTERFWPTSGDYIQELQKCERILRTFCVEGLPTEESTADGKKKKKVYRKIPPKVIQEAKGIVIYTAMRSGIAPFAGAGGGGVVIVRMKDGSWSPPSFLSPNNLSAGLMLGLDVYNAVLVLRSDAAVQGFRTHHFTVGSEIAVAAGPLGYGVSAETGVKNRTPIFSYILSKGFYAGVEVVGQVFVDRFDENERVYHWPGIKAGDIMDGKVRRPVEADRLYQALYDAEAGIAQGSSLEWDTDEVKQLDLEPGEVLKLPPTPDQLTLFESIGIKDEEDIKLEEEERKAVRLLPPPPKHPHARNARFRPRASPGFLSTPSSPNVPATPSSGFTSPQSDSGMFSASTLSLDESPTSEVAPEETEAYTTVIRQPLPRRPVPPLPVLTAIAAASEEKPSEDVSEIPAPADEQQQPIAIVNAAETQESIVDETKEGDFLAPPLLQHQDSSSSVSVYSDASEAQAPPEYDEARAKEAAPEKDKIDQSDAQ